METFLCEISKSHLIQSLALTLMDINSFAKVIEDTIKKVGSDTSVVKQRRQAVPGTLKPGQQIAGLTMSVRLRREKQTML